MVISPWTKFWYSGLSQWLPIEKLADANVGGKSIHIQKPEINYSRVRFLWILTAVVLISIISLYGAFFNSLSETMLVELSFYWFGPLSCCIVALIATYNRYEKAILYGLIAALLSTIGLILFFAGLWNSL